MSRHWAGSGDFETRRLIGRLQKNPPERDGGKNSTAFFGLKAIAEVQVYAVVLGEVTEDTMLGSVQKSRPQREGYRVRQAVIQQAIDQVVIESQVVRSPELGLILTFLPQHTA